MDHQQLPHFSELKSQDQKVSSLLHCSESPIQDSEVRDTDCFDKTVKLHEWKLSEQTLKSLQQAQAFAESNWDSPRGLDALYRRQQRMRHFNPCSYFGGVDRPDTELLELLEDPRLSDMFKSLKRGQCIFPPTLSTQEDTPTKKATNFSSPRSTEASSLIHKFTSESPQIIDIKPKIGPRLKPPLCPTLPAVRRNALKRRLKLKEESQLQRRPPSAQGRQCCSLLYQRTEEFKRPLESMRETQTQRQKSRHKKQMSLGRGGHTFQFLFEEQES